MGRPSHFSTRPRSPAIWHPELMTDPRYGPFPSDDTPPTAQPWDYPPPPPGQYPYPAAPGVYYDPMAPYGRHPVTGEPYSDKSKVIAGLLQLLGLVGFLGFGRIYVGQTGYGVAQLIIGILTCGVVAFIWGIVDVVLIFSGSVRDNAGRPLRDGT